MAIPDLALAKIRRFCVSKVPSSLRHEVRFEATVRGDSVTIVDRRRPWDGEGGEWSRVPIARLRYEPGARSWSLFWARANGRWMHYEDMPATTNLDDVLREIGEDPSCLFFG